MIVISRAPVRIDFGGAWTDVDIFAHGSGGVVLNATIDQYISGRLKVLEAESGPQTREGLNVSYGFDLPSGSGLGTSSALNVVWLSLIKSRIASHQDRVRIAELAYQLEAMLGILGGRQDQYAAALGGFNLMRFGVDGVSVEQIGIKPETIAELEARSVLIYTGKPRLSGSIHENVWGAFREGRPATVNALYRLRELALGMAGALETGDLDHFADMITENWACQRALDDSVTNAQIDHLFVVAQEAGARGGKACGAGGGGCLYFVTHPGQRDAVSDALAQAGARVLPFKFEAEGLTVQIESD